MLWFMYTLAGLYLLTPILSTWLRTAGRREVRFYLLLWGVALCVPYLQLFLHVDTGDTSVLYYFTGYAGYFLLGYYLTRHYRFAWWHIAVALTIAVAAPAVLYGSGMEFDFYRMLWYLNLPVAALAFIYFVLLRRLHIAREHRWLTTTSRLCFGIYLMHIFVMRNILWHIPALTTPFGTASSFASGITSIALIAILTWLISWCASYLLSRTPAGKYLIAA